MVPFCPHRLQNLSPIAGILSSLIRTFANRFPSSPSVINDLSTYPNCPFFGKTDPSLYIFGFSRSLLTFPINTILSFNLVFSLINPCLSKCE